MLRDRLLTAACLIAVTLVLMWLDAVHPPWGVEGLWLLPLLLFFSIGTAHDAGQLLLGAGRLISARAATVAAAAVAASAAIPMLWPLLRGADYPADCPIGRLGWIVIGSAAAIGGLLLLEMSRYGRGPSGATERVAAGVFVALYVGIPMALLLVIRGLGESRWGLAALITLVVVTKSTDTGAYFVGRAVGRHKLIPRLSPGKTREGAVGGIVAAIAAAYGCVMWLFPALVDGPQPAPPWGPAVLGFSCAIAGMAGDLAESLIKRDSGAKDSGSWLPGMGGVWDVTDSMIFSSLPGFLCFASGLAGS